MNVENLNFTITTKGFEDSIDITEKIKNFAKAKYIENGLINIFIASSTSGLIITEDEPGIVADIKNHLSAILPVNKVYEHDLSWQTGNGYSYLKALYFAKNISIPIQKGELMLDKYQKIIMFDFNTAPGNIKITATLIKDNG